MVARLLNQNDCLGMQLLIRYQTIYGILLHTVPSTWFTIKFLIILTVIHLINKFSSPPIHSKTFYEILFAKSPSIKHLKVFGCSYYVTKLGHTTFDATVVTSVFIGYSFTQKSYEVYSLESQEVSINQGCYTMKHAPLSIFH